MKKLVTILVTVALAISLAACGAQAPASSTSSKDAKTNDENADTCDITVIIKATDSDYWQTLLLGAEAAAEESDGAIKVTTAGPPSETDIDQQVSILENAIAAGPDGIVIASTSCDATVPAIEEAMSKKIPVVTIDNKLNTENYTSFLATDHTQAAGLAAEAMVKDWEAAGIDPSGKKVVVISSVAGTAVNTARTEGFIQKIKELVPTIEVLETQYGDNDIAKALDISNNLIAANSDLIGIFGDNNHMGVGISKSIEENDIKDQIMAYAFDADADEITAIETGYLRGIVVQDPFGMGYDGVLMAAADLKGETVEKDVVVPATVVTKNNMQEEKVQKLLYPGK